ncbi:MAG TPA: PIN domain nuclease [Ramlibacter sp.]|uniref:type II toxin-antitoxin system VapC family toxin n=1 Tax=Ramlibacter sp. TaxID=1917967 RepID=UPI002D7FF7BA|nr:PIN domain nuclease [Ramlibacter sp.]HET8748359.1 PIN domain nuclease [Ramlibacter sp.]
MIADSSAWIEYLRGTGSAVHKRLRQALSRREPVWMLDVIYQEVLQGARDPADFVRLQRVLDQPRSWTPDDPRGTVRRAALLYATCRWRGVTPRSANDCLIAACAIEADEPLLHADSDFERIASIEPRLRLL